jgi:hypothetical protein
MRGKVVKDFPMIVVEVLRAIFAVSRYIAFNVWGNIPDPSIPSAVEMVTREMPVPFLNVIAFITSSLDGK